MRIEKHGDVEYLIGAPKKANNCDVSVDGWYCYHHFDGQHVATDASLENGDQRIRCRWPIEPTDAPTDPFALGVVDGLRRVESMIRDLDGRVVLADRKLELLAECIAAEVADVNDAIANRQPVRGES